MIRTIETILGMIIVGGMTLLFLEYAVRSVC
jgi:hypothetical protein